MFDLNPETVRLIISKAHEFQTDDDVSFLEENLSPFESATLDFQNLNHESTTTQGFSSIINDLEPDQQQTLVALMWVGRGDFSIDEWDDAIAQARSSWTLHTAEYLLSTPLLADYLEEGLDLHGYEEE